MREFSLVVILLMGTFATLVLASEPTKTPTPNTKTEKTLSDVAGEIELNKKAVGDKDSIVISDENLAELAGKGRVTEVTKPGSSQTKRGLADVQGTGAEIEGEAPGYAETLEKKQYWQAIYGQQLKLVEDIRKQIDILDYDIPGLWRDFYSRDDPAYRDGVIKPKLDQALAQRQKLEVDKQKAESRLNKIKNDARGDGGEPGWFRGFKKPPTPKPTIGIMPP
jgi:hypothetical protein